MSALDRFSNDGCGDNRNKRRKVNNSDNSEEQGASPGTCIKQSEEKETEKINLLKMELRRVKKERDHFKEENKNLKEKIEAPENMVQQQNEPIFVARLSNVQLKEMSTMLFGMDDIFVPNILSFLRITDLVKCCVVSTSWKVCCEKAINCSGRKVKFHFTSNEQLKQAVNCYCGTDSNEYERIVKEYGYPIGLKYSNEVSSCWGFYFSDGTRVRKDLERETN